jgi:hypothetical protein
MTEKKDKSIIRLDYAALGDNATNEGPIPIELVKKAQGMLGRQAREEILRLIDGSLRVQSAEVAQRRVSPVELYKAGQEGVLEAIKVYRPEQDKAFREFAIAFARQAMAVARNKVASEPQTLRPPPLPKESLGKDPPPGES